MSMMRGGPHGGGPFGRPGAPAGAPATNAKATAKRLLIRLDKQRKQLWIVMLLTVAGTGTGLLGPKLLGDATNKVFEGAF